jgi:hypothetical protein
MLGGHVLLEARGIKWHRFSAFFAPYQLSTNRLDFRVACLVAANSIANVFDDVGEATGFDLRFDPLVLLIGDGNGLACGSHVSLHSAVLKIILLTQHHVIFRYPARDVPWMVVLFCAIQPINNS